MLKKLFTIPESNNNANDVLANLGFGAIGPTTAEIQSKYAVPNSPQPSAREAAKSDSEQHEWRANFEDTPVAPTMGVNLEVPKNTRLRRRQAIRRHPQQGSLDRDPLSPSIAPRRFSLQNVQLQLQLSDRTEDPDSAENVELLEKAPAYPEEPPPPYQSPKVSPRADETAPPEVLKEDEDGVSHSNEPPPDPEAQYSITTELKELFRCIDEFEADRIALEPTLKPFMTNYIPAIGDEHYTDDDLGLTVLDEPAAIQSDPAIIELKLRQLSKIFSDPDELPSKKLDRADKNVQQIDQWIENIKASYHELHRSKPLDRMRYSKPMPDVEKLMQEWEPDEEAAVNANKLPTANLSVSLEEYTDLCLSLADIPVHSSRIEALHLLFTLYAEIKSSQHYRNMAANNGYDDAASEVNRLELSD